MHKTPPQEPKNGTCVGPKPQEGMVGGVMQNCRKHDWERIDDWNRLHWHQQV